MDKQRKSNAHVIGNPKEENQYKSTTNIKIYNS
jgi:hypothetical protein